ncbi:cysteine proteinase [Athelia psychrophila]|uniref:ubiquitinyl hydrolase 1 n=1 Tax=Athelia psychrophila TaxID=1759441 RepID=A0A166K5Y0_9AGAM|nr:cysteine proteinase [Fibularhizoctonia sp. CBS 109695]
MVFESLGLPFGASMPWNWGSAAHASGSGHERKKSKKKHPRTRADQVAMNGQASRDELLQDPGVDDGHYPGLVNISGTYCFMNSTLQAMASLSYVQPQLEAIHARAEALDVPTPVIDALQELLQQLNAPTSRSSSLRPVDIISALSNPSPGKHNSLFSSREHQDAQELFQLLSECIKTETAAVDKEGYRDRGLGGLGTSGREGSSVIGKSVFDGLTANRRSCMECGYTEAVMHFAFDNWQLAVPRMSTSVPLEACIADYTRLELLTDCICRKCSLLATHKRLDAEAARLADIVDSEPNPSVSKKKRAKEARKLETKVKQALEDGRIEDDIKGVKMDKVFSKASTKQAMVARPPPVLALHLNRSMHYGQYAAKNNVRILFPEILDLTPFTTSGNLSTVPAAPISTPPPSIPRSTTPTPATYATPRTIYRLAAIVCHYGQHSFGHYVCYRRKPRPPSAAQARWAPPQLAHPLGCDCQACEQYGPVRDADGVDEHGRARVRNGPGSGRGWLRTSDDKVAECGIEAVLQEGAGAFMLYYERVVTHAGVYPHARSPRSSEETLKPAVPPHADMNASMLSLASVASSMANGTGNGHGNGHAAGTSGSFRESGGVALAERKPRLGPRLVRSVAPGRRSLSATPPDRAPAPIALPTPRAEDPPSEPDDDTGPTPLAMSLVLTALPPSAVPDDASPLSASMPNLPRRHTTPLPAFTPPALAPVLPQHNALGLVPATMPLTPPASPPRRAKSPLLREPSAAHRVQSPQPLHPPAPVGLRTRA